MLKRLFDLLGSVLGLLAISPLFLLLAGLVRLKMGSPVFFTQKRPGKEGEIFLMYKFRTMTGETDKDGNLLPDDQRLTQFGRILRSTSLDELSELINVVKGEMSWWGRCRDLINGG